MFSLFFQNPKYKKKGGKLPGLTSKQMIKEEDYVLIMKTEGPLVLWMQDKMIRGIYGILFSPYFEAILSNLALEFLRGIDETHIFGGVLSTFLKF